MDARFSNVFLGHLPGHSVLPRAFGPEAFAAQNRRLPLRETALRPLLTRLGRAWYTALRRSRSGRTPERKRKMTQAERRRYLIETLLLERPQYREIAVPADARAQKDLLRALMNVRAPEPIGDAFLAVQDEYLRAERAAEGIVDGERLPSVPGDARLVLWQGDITSLKVDAIVNAANSALLGCFYPLHGCIDNIIHTRSGIQLRLYCNEMMQRQGHAEETGGAKITPAFNLPCRYVLHTVGPIIDGRVTEKNRAQLASCYRSCLELAVENGCKSVAFCCISTGEFHFPADQAAAIAVETVKRFLHADGDKLRVIFDVFKDSDLQIYRKILGVGEC